MQRPRRSLLLCLLMPALLLALSTDGGAAPAARATPVALQTLVRSSVPIEALAQDTGTLAWIDARHEVHIERLSTSTASVVGSARSQVGGVVSPTQLALGGVRALWTTYAGGLTRETVVESSAPGEHSGAMECLSVIAGSIPACQSEMRRR